MPVPMNLRAVLDGVKLRRPIAETLLEKNVAGLEYDSRRVSKDTLFFAFPGSRVDGRQFAQDAIAKGICAVISELPAPEGLPEGLEDNQPHWVQVEHGRKAMAAAAANFYGHPDRRIHFTGVTGTNGKTTTAYLIDGILRHAGKVTGMIGTVEYRIAGETRNAVNTTPESLDVMRLAEELEQRGGTFLTMEVSSHGLALARIYGLCFHTAVFTNLTPDHLDFHHSMEDYAAAKRLLFQPESGVGPQWAVLNRDDPASDQMLPHSGTRVLWYGVGENAELRAENVRSGFDGLHFELVYGGQGQPIQSTLVGSFNVLNILAAAGAAISYGLDLATIADGIAACPAVPGRFERVECGQPFLVVVDFAHTDDALRNVLRVSRDLLQAQSQQRKSAGRLITVFGCGGDRDRSKRPIMGATAAQLSDFVVLTSDNPRSEDPLDIMNDVMVGLGRFDTPHISQPDRAQALRLAFEQARPGDLVLIAGKGHEPYQILKDRTIEFDDRDTARHILRHMGYGKVETGVLK